MNTIKAKKIQPPSGTEEEQGEPQQLLRQVSVLCKEANDKHGRKKSSEISETRGKEKVKLAQGKAIRDASMAVMVFPESTYKYVTDFVSKIC